MEQGTLAHSLGKSFVSTFLMSMCRENNWDCTRARSYRQTVMDIRQGGSSMKLITCSANRPRCPLIVWSTRTTLTPPPCNHSSLSSSSPLVPLLQRWKQWTVEARKKLVMMATTDTEMPEKMMMSRSVRVRVAWHSRKLSFESWVRDTRLPSMGREHSMPSTPALKQEITLDWFTREVSQSWREWCHIYGLLDQYIHMTATQELHHIGKQADGTEEYTYHTNVRSVFAYFFTNSLKI